MRCNIHAIRLLSLDGPVNQVGIYEENLSGAAREMQQKRRFAVIIGTCE
jgi:hypothetical protein